MENINQSNESYDLDKELDLGENTAFSDFEKKLSEGTLRQPSVEEESVEKAEEVVEFVRTNLAENPLVRSKMAKAANLMKMKIAHYKSRQAGKDPRDLIGLLVLDGKGPLPWECAALLDMIISPKTVKNFNYIHNSAPEDLADTVVQQFAGEAATGANAWVVDGGRAGFYYGAVMHKVLIEKNGASKSPAAYFKSIMDTYAAPAADGSHPLMDQFAEIEEFFESGTVLGDAREFLKTNAGLDAKERGIYMGTVQTWCFNFMKSAALRPWANSDESDIDIAQILYGLRVGVALPSTEYGDAGIAIQTLVKAQIYRMIKVRGNNRMELGQSKVAVIMDECQRAMDKLDVEILPEARSMDLICIFATQNVDGIFTRFHGDEGKKFLEAFGSIITFISSPATHGYMQERIGKSRIIQKSGKGITIDFANTATQQMGSPYFDLNNPYRYWMRKTTLSSFFSNFFKRNPVHKAQDHDTLMNETNLDGISTLTVSQDEKYIVSEKNIQTLNTPFTAIASVKNGGVNRRDVIKSVALDNNFQIIDTSMEKSQGILDQARNANLKKAA